MKIHRVAAVCTALAVTGALAVAAPAQAAPTPTVPSTQPSTGETAAAATVATVAGTGRAPAYRKYVALGDSYTSAPLVPLPELTSLGCVRSLANYPKLVAAALRVQRFTDVSCGGADTTHMTRPQQTPLGTFPAQFDALTPDTDLVTVGIGGNDFGVFGRIIDTCPKVRASDPTGAPCQERFTVGGTDTLKADIARTQDRITTVAKAIRTRAPKATVILVGYPRIAPAQGTCPTILPFADGDYAYLNSVEQALNTAVENAATAAGVQYLDTFGPSEGHDACAPDGQAWIQGKDINLLRAISYHPRFEGQAGVAVLTVRQLAGQQPAVTPAEQRAFARQSREQSRRAAASGLPQKLTTSHLAHLDRLRTGAQR